MGHGAEHERDEWVASFLQSRETDVDIERCGRGCAFPLGDEGVEGAVEAEAGFGEGGRRGRVGGEG